MAVAWPDKWESSAQAALAGVLVTSTVGLVSILAKGSFDQLSLATQYRLNARNKILETSFDYARDYLLLLAGVAGELAAYLDEYLDARSASPPRPEDMAVALDGAFYFTAMYIRLEGGLLCTIPLGTGRPLGLFLRSKEAEDRVFDLMVGNWALGIRGLESEAILIRELCDQTESRKLISPATFIERSRIEGSELAKIKLGFDSFMTDNQLVGETADAMLVLNDIVNYEVRQILEPWYGATFDPVPASAANLSLMSQELKEALGLFYKPLG